MVLVLHLPHWYTGVVK